MIAILKHYLDDHPPSQVSHQLLVDEVKNLKEEIKYIKICLLEAGAKSLGPKIPDKVIVFPNEPMEIDHTSDEAETGLTTYQTDKAASEQELSTNDYLLKITSWKVGEGKRPKYYPVTQ